MGIYSPEKSVAFVHIPKCAGWSVKLWLADNVGGFVVPETDEWHGMADELGLEVEYREMPKGHLRLADWEEHIGTDPRDYDLVIATRRDPYEVAISQWAYWRRLWKGKILERPDGSLIKQRTGMVQHRVAAQHAVFQEWLENPRSEYHVRYAYNDRYKSDGPQPPRFKGEDAPGYADYGGYYAYWLAIDGEIPDNVVTIDVRDLHEDLPALVSDLIEGEPAKVERINALASDFALAEHYTPEAVKIVESRFAYAFEHWYEKREFTRREDYTPRRRYEVITPEDLLDDTAYAAERDGWVDNHTQESVRKVGAWRWSGLHDYRDEVVRILRDAETAVDLGGAAGPVGYGALVVDPETDRPTLHDIEGQVDALFCCHTLEHIRDIDGMARVIADKVRPGGHLIVFGPSCHADHLRAENWGQHYQTFYASEHTENPKDGWRALDDVFRPWFDIEVCEYPESDRNALMMIARRHERPDLQVA